MWHAPFLQSFMCRRQLSSSLPLSVSLPLKTTACMHSFALTIQTSQTGLFQHQTWQHHSFPIVSSCSNLLTQTLVFQTQFGGICTELLRMNERNRFDSFITSVKVWFLVYLLDTLSGPFILIHPFPCL